jgi:hypothetical protein
MKIGIVLIVILATLGYFGFATQQAKDVSAYTDNEASFTIDLPQGWAVFSKEVSESVSSTWFQSASSTNATSSIQLAIERFKRTSDMNKTIKTFGTGPFTQGLIESLWVDLGLDIKKNEIVKIGDESFVHIHSTYVGKDTKREVTQHMFFIFTDLYYYRIGVDAYTDVWKKYQGDVMKSVYTFKVLSQ